MARPTKGYFAADGARVPSVTEVLDRFKPSGGLIHWAWKEGMAGRDYNATRDAAANAGKLAHSWIEATVAGVAFPIPIETDPDVYLKAQQAHANFVKWYAKSGLTIVDTERPLVSEAHRFGGTYDAVATKKSTRNGKTKIIALDFKTSNRIYHEHLYQVAAYGLLMLECTSYGWPDEYHIFQMDKEKAVFKHKVYKDLTREREAFLKLREAFGLVKECEGRKL